MTRYNKKSFLGFLVHLHPPRIPNESSQFNYTFGLGGSVIFYFVLTFFSGFALLFFYEPSVENANASIHAIQSIYEFGWFFRSLHFWAGNLMVVTSMLHLIRIAVNGGYLQGRKFNWLIGIILLFFILWVDFTGYVLRWDKIYYDALMVAYGLVNEIPKIGGVISHIIFGAEIGSPTSLNRLYMFHIVGLPLAIFGLMIFHLWRIRKDGGISSRRKMKTSYIIRETLLNKEVRFMWLLWIIVLLLSLIWIPNIGLPLDSKSELYGTQAPWMFAWIQFLLRSIPPFWAGVVIPAFFIIVLSFLPYVDNQESEIGIAFSRNRIWYWGTIVVIHLVIVVLILIEFKFY